MKKDIVDLEGALEERKEYTIEAYEAGRLDQQDNEIVHNLHSQDIKEIEAKVDNFIFQQKCMEANDQEVKRLEEKLEEQRLIEQEKALTQLHDQVNTVISMQKSENSSSDNSRSDLFQIERRVAAIEGTRPIKQ